MGVVYKAQDTVIDRTVALKAIKQDHLDSAEAEQILQRFKREAQAAGRLNHPNIVTVYEYGVENGITFIAMEYVDGRTLKEAIANNERFSLQAIRKIIRDILEALSSAHRQGVIHRDIKPDNILLPDNGGIKIADFGIARIESSELTQHGDLMGTPAYMSPEQCMGNPVDNRTDIFSTGAILYHLLTGEKPFPGENMTTIMHRVVHDSPIAPSELNLTVSTSLDYCVVKALEKNPNNRFQNAEEFLAALDASFEAAENSFSPPHSSSGEETVLGTSPLSKQQQGDNWLQNISSAFFTANTRIKAGIIAIVLSLFGIALWMLLGNQTTPQEETVLHAPARKTAISKENTGGTEKEAGQKAEIGLTSKPLDSEKTKIIPYQDRQRGIRPQTN